MLQGGAKKVPRGEGLGHLGAPRSHHLMHLDAAYQDRRKEERLRSAALNMYTCHADLIQARY